MAIRFVRSLFMNLKKMKPFNALLIVVLILLTGSMSGNAQETGKVSITMQQLKLVFDINASGTPEYALFYKDKPVILTSKLGFRINKTIEANQNFRLLKVDSTEIDHTWKPVWGEVKNIRNHYRELTAHIQQSTAPYLMMNIVFRVFEDGLGFRYEFPLQQTIKFFVIDEEQTEFKLTGDHKAFWIPADYDENEYKYTISKLSEIDAWKYPILSSGSFAENIPDRDAVQTPLMLKTAEGIYMNIHEAALVNYPAMQLHINKANSTLSSNLVPDAVGNKAYLRTPAKTPWRTVIISDKATDILASKLILNLNEPSKIKNTNWIKPTKFMGVWWEMQTGLSSWSYTDNIDSLSADGKLVPHGHHGANTANVKKYIDFAAKNGIKGLLVEGWNLGWEEWTGNWKEENFDFVTPYPDFDVKGIERYAKQKGVQMIMHNETGASATNFDRLLDTSFRFMKQFGYTAVKTGYVGKIIPNGEHHDGQWMVRHYERVAKKAAAYHIMVDMHEPVRPSGLSRTYPNWMACEAGRGNEWNAFSDGSSPDHETILPFTRLMGGPMDYTPGIFKLRNYAKGAPERHMHTTLAKQLALYVTIYSPVQMAADLPENYEAHLDAFQFIKDVPVDWDDTKVLEAEPGEFITMVRKEKGKNSWFLGAITNEKSRTSNISLDFLDPGKTYIATIYADATDADWQTNPEDYQINQYRVDAATKLHLKLANGGGTAISITPASVSSAKSIQKY